jgi:hypothetical protein
MANLPPNLPAHFNPVATQLRAGTAVAQVQQSLQQEETRQGVREEAREVAANALVQRAKKAVQLAVVQQGSGDPRDTLPGLTAIADRPELLNNIGLG